ncbi:MAG: hypothetical protein V1746_04895 [bacterium]
MNTEEMESLAADADNFIQQAKFLLEAFSSSSTCGRGFVQRRLLASIKSVSFYLYRPYKPVISPTSVPKKLKLVTDVTDKEPAPVRSTIAEQKMRLINEFVEVVVEKEKEEATQIKGRRSNKRLEMSVEAALRCLVKIWPEQEPHAACEKLEFLDKFKREVGPKVRGEIKEYFDPRTSRESWRCFNASAFLSSYEFLYRKEEMERERGVDSRGHLDGSQREQLEEVDAFFVNVRELKKNGEESNYKAKKVIESFFDVPDKQTVAGACLDAMQASIGLWESLMGFSTGSDKAEDNKSKEH